MKSLFRWTLNHNLVGFAILVLLQILIFAIGFPLILHRYEQNRIGESVEQARAILIDAESPAQLEIDNTRPFFVFSADGELIYSNRGMGRSIASTDMFPIKFRNRIVGYYYGENFRFASTPSNTALLGSSIGLLIFSLAASTVVGLLMAMRSSRSIVKSVEQINVDIDAIKGKDAVQARRFEVAELTEISATLAKLHRQLLAQEEYQQQWMQDISHDLRTPISGLKGQLEGIRDGVFTADPPRMERLLSEIERLKDLTAGVGNLLQLENMEELQPEPFPLIECIRGLLRSHEVSLTEREIQLRLPDTEYTVYAQRDLFERAVGNVIDNSLKFTPTQGLITITASRNDDYHELTIINNGPPIAPEHAERIFQRMYRGEGGRSTPGSGLGLNIAREIMRRHGGEVSLVRNDESGVAFEFRIPLEHRGQ